jgi:hypothetical protein
MVAVCSLKCHHRMNLPQATALTYLRHHEMAMFNNIYKRQHKRRVIGAALTRRRDVRQPSDRSFARRTRACNTARPTIFI